MDTYVDINLSAHPKDPAAEPDVPKARECPLCGHLSYPIVLGCDGCMQGACQKCVSRYVRVPALVDQGTLLTLCPDCKETYDEYVAGRKMLRETAAALLRKVG